MEHSTGSSPDKQTYAIQQSGSPRFRETVLTVIIGLCACVAIAIAFWLLYFPKNEPATVAATPAASNSRLVVTFLDIGEGDSAFIRSPNGKYMLIDGGMSRNEYSDFDAGEHYIIPFLKENGVEKLDWVVATHPHNDHMGGLLSVLENIPVTNVMDCGMQQTTFTYERFLTLVKEKNITYHLGYEGLIPEFDEALFLQVLHPEKDKLVESANNNSIVIRMLYKSISFLFVGDIEQDMEAIIARYGYSLKSTFLKVPHHGSDTSSTELFLNLVQPEAAFFPVGLYNKHGHPSKTVVERYRNRNIKIYRTDQDKNITVITDGLGYKILTGT